MGYVTLYIMWSFVKKYPSKYWPWYVFGFIALVLTTFVTTLIPIEIMHIVDAIHQEQGWATLQPMIVRLISFAMGLAVVRTLSRILIFTPGRYVEYDLRKEIHAHLLNLPPVFFREHTIGDTMSRMINDIQALRLMSAFGFLHIINTTMIYALVMVQMMTIHPMLTFWVLLPVPFALLIIRFFVKRLYKYIKASQEQLGLITDFFVESVANMSLIKTYTAEQRIIHEMQKDNIRYRDTQIGLASIRSTMFPFIATIGSIGQIILLYQGGQYVIGDQLTIGELVAFSTYLGLLAWPTAALSWIINIIQRGMASLVRVQDILSTPPHPQLDAPTTSPMQKAPKITLKNLTFHYEPTAKPVLSDISLTIQPGDRLGIFGATGSGKTTLANLVGLLEPTAPNTIFYDDIDVTQSNVTQLRSGISLVPQKRFLFSTTILKNILFANPNDEKDAAELAAKRACILGDINDFPEQWDTMVGEKGIMLSGGQQHRLAMARAYAANHHVLILDDVLSSVDHDTEHQMVEALYNSPNPPTTIIIAHRISALSDCNQIIVLDDGQIIAQGTHEELIAKDGAYKATWQYQQMEAQFND
jgi:ATP-binding cassette subfamily B multidrug efflux pump